MEFILNGKSSRNFNLKIKESNHLLRPRKKIELIDIPGRTGALIIDEGARENFNAITLEFSAYREVEDETFIV